MSGKPVIVIGGGGHAKVVIDVLRMIDRHIVGIVDPVLAVGSQIAGCKVLGGDGVLEGVNSEEVELANGVGGTQSTDPRNALYQRLRSEGFHFPLLVHPSATISHSAKLADGVQVMAGCVVQADAIVGANSIVNTCASIDHDCRIGESVHIAPGVVLSGSVIVGDGSHIGTGAIVIQGICIGRNSLVAAGAVVIRDLPDGARHIKGY